MFFKEALAYGLPKQGSDVAVAWDHLYIFLLWLSVFFFVIVVGGMIYLAVKYRKRDGVKPKYILDNHALELFWTIVPTILLMFIFVWGWDVYKSMVRAPSNAMEIRVIGKQWLWNFQYDDGRVLTNEVYVPLNTPVKFLMSSEDVLHSFFVPSFRVKSDVVPGMYTSVWFEAKEPGEHQVFCTEYCGASHSLMLAKVKVLEADKWEMWKRGKPVEVTGAVKVADAAAGGTTLSLPEQGLKLTQEKGCVACHNSTGQPGGIGPTYKGSFGTEREFADGSKAVMDEAYLRESILKPTAKTVKGFAMGVMPPYQGLLKEEELNAVVAYIKSLK
jgi:cytochrome c oxidase subunit II